MRITTLYHLRVLSHHVYTDSYMRNMRETHPYDYGEIPLDIKILDYLLYNPFQIESVTISPYTSLHNCSFPKVVDKSKWEFTIPENLFTRGFTHGE